MVLCWRRYGRAGGCRIPKKKNAGNFEKSGQIYIDAGFYQWLESINEQYTNAVIYDF